MGIQHGNSNYRITFVISTISSAGINSTNFYDLDEFRDCASSEFPEVDFSSYYNFCEKFINDIRNWIDMGKAYNENWRDTYLYCGVVGKEVICSKNGNILYNKLRESYERYKDTVSNFICKVECYGWNVTSIKDTGMTKITYYTVPSEGDTQKYPIYAYKDYIILGNGNPDKPTIITDRYFLYNGGKKDS